MSNKDKAPKSRPNSGISTPGQSPCNSPAQKRGLYRSVLTNKLDENLNKNNSNNICDQRPVRNAEVHTSLSNKRRCISRADPATQNLLENKAVSAIRNDAINFQLSLPKCEQDAIHMEEQYSLFTCSPDDLEQEIAPSVENVTPSRENNTTSTRRALDFGQSMSYNK